MNVKNGAVAVPETDPFQEEQATDVTEAPASAIETAVLEQVEAAGGVVQERTATRLLLVDPEARDRGMGITDECKDLIADLTDREASDDLLRDLLEGAVSLRWQVDAVLAANGQLVERVETLEAIVHANATDAVKQLQRLKADVEALKTAAPAPTGAARFNQTQPKPELHTRLVQIAGFERCSGMQPLRPGEKCNGHQLAPGQHGLCPTAFRAAKMLENNVPVETIAARFGPKA